MRKWNSKTPSRCLEKTPVGGFKTILKRASGDCVEGSETQAWSTAQGRRQGVKERQEGIASNKAWQSQVWQRRQAAEVCKQQGNCLEASAEVYNRRQWSTVETAPTENTSVHGHDSYLGSSLGEKRCLQGTRLPSYRRTCKKVRLKHGRDRERTRSCLTAGHSRDSIRPSARPTLTYRGKEKRQTDNVCLTTVYRNGMRGAKSEGAQITYTQKVQDTEQVTKKDALRKDWCTIKNKGHRTYRGPIGYSNTLHKTTDVQFSVII